MAKKVYDICTLCGKALDQKVKKRKQGRVTQKGNLFISAICPDCVELENAFDQIANDLVNAPTPFNIRAIEASLRNPYTTFTLVKTGG